MEKTRKQFKALKISGTCSSPDLDFTPVTYLALNDERALGAEMPCFHPLSHKLLCSMNAALWLQGWMEMGLAVPSGGRPGRTVAPLCPSLERGPGWTRPRVPEK